MREAAGGAIAALAAHLQPRSVPAVVAALLDGMAPSCAWQTKARADPAVAAYALGMTGASISGLEAAAVSGCWDCFDMRLNLQAPAGLSKRRQRACGSHACTRRRCRAWRRQRSALQAALTRDAEAALRAARRARAGGQLPAAGAAGGGGAGRAGGLPAGRRAARVGVHGRRQGPGQGVRRPRVFRVGCIRAEG